MLSESQCYWKSLTWLGSARFKASSDAAHKPHNTHSLHASSRHTDTYKSATRVTLSYPTVKHTQLCMSHSNIPGLSAILLWVWTSRWWLAAAVHAGTGSEMELRQRATRGAGLIYHVTTEDRYLAWYNVNKQKKHLFDVCYLFNHLLLLAKFHTGLHKSKYAYKILYKIVFVQLVMKLFRIKTISASKTQPESLFLSFIYIFISESFQLYMLVPLGGDIYCIHRWFAGEQAWGKCIKTFHLSGSKAGSLW